MATWSEHWWNQQELGVCYDRPKDDHASGIRRIPCISGNGIYDCALFRYSSRGFGILGIAGVSRTRLEEQMTNLEQAPAYLAEALEHKDSYWVNLGTYPHLKLPFWKRKP